ncbi:hypothetical protein QBC38DRAFT_148763 [Podospora fimiseda]|uniref:Rhodopsin domain-containing protein n=1 Tax=Podospora fimiseda TaxID=252190 RepID=A0AAN7H0U4_9PEZI|nr:hypothetical protein QBC38DRAFT_148763 [Podospora fimiseda]
MSDPAALVPTGETGDANGILVVSGLCALLSIIFIIIRFYIRVAFRQGVKCDDWMLLLSTLLFLLLGSILVWCYSIADGLVTNLDRPMENDSDGDGTGDSEVELYLKLLLALAIIYFTLATTTKLGILIMYNRIFEKDQIFRYQLWAVTGLVIAFWVATTVANLTSCVPLHYNWINTLQDPRYCFNQNVFWAAAGSAELALDALVLALPIGALSRVRLTFHQKLSAGGIFFLGGFIIITGIVRVVVGYDPYGRVPKHYDIVVWTSLHSGVSLVCATLPVMGPLMRIIRHSKPVKKLFQLASRSNTSRTNTANSRSRPRARVTSSPDRSDLREETTANEDYPEPRRLNQNSTLSPVDGENDPVV